MIAAHKHTLQHLLEHTVYSLLNKSSLINEHTAVSGVLCALTVFHSCVILRKTLCLWFLPNWWFPLQLCMHCTSNNERFTRLFSFRVNAMFPYSPEWGFPKIFYCKQAEVMLEWPLKATVYTLKKWTQHMLSFSHVLGCIHFFSKLTSYFKDIVYSNWRLLQMLVSKGHLNLVIYKVLKFLHCKKGC